MSSPGTTQNHSSSNNEDEEVDEDELKATQNLIVANNDEGDEDQEEEWAPNAGSDYDDQDDDYQGFQFPNSTSSSQQQQVKEDDEADEPSLSPMMNASQGSNVSNMSGSSSTKPPVNVAKNVKNTDVFSTTAVTEDGAATTTTTAIANNRVSNNANNSASFLQRRRGGQIQMLAAPAAQDSSKNKDDDEDSDSDSYYVEQGHHDKEEGGTEVPSKNNNLDADSAPTTTTTAVPPPPAAAPTPTNTSSAPQKQQEQAHPTSLDAKLDKAFQNLTFESNALIDYEIFDKRDRVLQAVSNFIKVVVDIHNKYKNEMSTFQKGRIPIAAIYRSVNLLGTELVGIASLAAKQGYVRITSHIKHNDIDHSPGSIMPTGKALREFIPHVVFPQIPVAFYPGDNVDQVPHIAEIIQHGVNNRVGKMNPNAANANTNSIPAAKNVPVELTEQEKAIAAFVKKIVKKHGEPVPEGEQQYRCLYNKVFEVFSASAIKNNPNAEPPKQATFNVIMTKLFKAAEIVLLGPVGDDTTFIRIGRRERPRDDDDQNDTAVAASPSSGSLVAPSLPAAASASASVSQNNHHQHTPHQEALLAQAAHAPLTNRQLRDNFMTQTIASPADAPLGVVCSVEEPGRAPYVMYREPHTHHLYDELTKQNSEGENNSSSPEIFWFMIFDFDIFLQPIRIVVREQPDFILGDWVILDFTDPAFPVYDPNDKSKIIPETVCLPVAAKGQCFGAEHDYKMLSIISREKDKLFRWREPRTPFTPVDQYAINRRASRAEMHEAMDNFAKRAKDLGQACEKIAREKHIPLSIHRVLIQFDFRRIFIFYKKHDRIDSIRSTDKIPELLFFELNRLLPIATYPGGRESLFESLKIFMIDVDKRENIGGKLLEAVTSASIKNQKKYANMIIGGGDDSASAGASASNSNGHHSVPSGWGSASPPSLNAGAPSSSSASVSARSYPPAVAPPPASTNNNGKSTASTADLQEQLGYGEAVFALIRLAPHHVELHLRGKYDFRLDDFVIVGHGELGADFGRVIAIGVQNRTGEILRMIQLADRAEIPIGTVLDQPISRVLRNASEAEINDYFENAPRKEKELLSAARQAFDELSLPYQVVDAHIQKDQQVRFLYLDCKTISYQKGPTCKAAVGKLFKAYGTLIRPIDITNNNRELRFGRGVSVEMLSLKNQQQQQPAHHHHTSMAPPPTHHHHQQQYQQHAPPPQQQQVRVVRYPFGPNPLALPPPFFVILSDPRDPYNSPREIFRRPIDGGLMLAPPPMIIQRF